MKNFDIEKFYNVPHPYIKYRFPTYKVETVLTWEDAYKNFSIPHSVLQRLKEEKITLLDTVSDPLTLAGLEDRITAIKDAGLTDKTWWVTDDLAAPNIFNRLTAWPESLALENYRAKTVSHPRIPIDIRKNKLSCLNRMYRPHRAYFIFWLRERSYFYDSVITHKDKVCAYTGNQIDPLTHDWFTREFDKDQRVLLQRANLDFEDVWDPRINANDHSWSHPAFSDTYLNVVTESVVDPGLYFSEKTFKPLAAGQLFVILGNKNSVRQLSQYGIECFFEDLDNHSYETSDCWIERANRLLALLDEIYHNIEDIYWQNIREIKHNQEWVLSNSFRKLCEKPLRDDNLIE